MSCLGVVNYGSGETRFTLGASWRIPYTLRLLPQSYGDEASQDYNITSFTAEYVDITFAYTADVTGTPDLSSSAVFRSAEWINNGNNTMTLRLYLRKTGVFNGYSVYWDGSNITFTFQDPQSLASGSKPLAGKRIVIDPGHGGDSSGTYGTIPDLYEKTLTLQYGLQLRDKLEALGATVIMTRTDDTLPDNAVNPASMEARTDYARNNGTDLFISIHMDGVKSQSANGCSVHYFNEYSAELAGDVFNRMYDVYTSYKDTTRRSARWDPFYVTRLHDCPSILIECGFMTNPDDMELLINDTFRDQLTAAICNGVIDYFQ